MQEVEKKERTDFVPIGCRWRNDATSTHERLCNESCNLDIHTVSGMSIAVYSILGRPFSLDNRNRHTSQKHV